MSLIIGGVSAPVAFAGATAGFTGLYQINSVVPPGVKPGDALPVIISIGSAASPPVTMAVQ